MRIGVIAPPWVAVPPEAYGGTEMVVDLLARGYAAAGHDVTLYTTGDSTCPVPMRATLPRARPAAVGDVVIEAVHVLDAYAALADCDVVHDHTTLGPIMGPHLVASPVVTTLHGPITPELIQLSSRLHVTAVAISHAQRAAAPTWPIARVIHHGIDVDASPFGHTGGGPAVFLARMAPEKGVDAAIRVARAADVPLVIGAKMWSGAERRYYRDVVAPLAAGADVEFAGELGLEEKGRLLAGARALLAPIRWEEPFGLFLVEALAAGTPVITFPRGAAPEIVSDGETGFLCTDEADMAAALGRVEEIDRARCRKTAEIDFSAERMVGEYLALFDEVVSGGVPVAPVAT